MRNRKLYLSEFVKRYEGNDYFNFVVYYNQNAIMFTLDEIIKTLSNTELWNKQVKKWKISNDLILINLD